MDVSIDFTIAFEEPDEDGWIVARVLEVPGAISQGRTREEARDNVLDALRTVLTPDDELDGRQSGPDLEHLRTPSAQRGLQGGRRGEVREVARAARRGLGLAAA